MKSMALLSLLVPFAACPFVASQSAVAQAPCCSDHAAPTVVAAPPQVSEWRPLWQTEKRERRTTVMKPVQKTYDRIEKSTVMKPVTETKYRERKVQETTYEEVTEMREERRVVQKPVIETEMREQDFPVRKEITETMTRTENVTQYKPVTVNQTRLVPGAPTVIDTGVSAFRPQVQWLRRGYYTDPQTGLQTWRGPGLHWVQPPTTAVVPTTVVQTVPTTTLVPEIVQKREPVEVTRYVDTVERRKVPVEVKRMVEEVQVRKIPVTVRRPKTVTRVERIPYQETRYEEQVVIKRTPVTETTYQPVTKVEPYEEETCRWVRHDGPVRREPARTVERVEKRVTEEWQNDSPQARETWTTESVRKPSLMETPAGSNPRQPTQTRSVLESLNYQGESRDDAVDSNRSEGQTEMSAPPQGTPKRLEQTTQRFDYSDVPVVRRPARLYEPSLPGTITVPETKPSLDRPRTKLARIESNDPAKQTESSPSAGDYDWNAPPAKLP